MGNRLYDLIGRKFLTLVDYEKDTTSCNELEFLAHQGVLGNASLLLFVMSHVFFRGKNLPDDLVITFLCLFWIIGAKRTLSPFGYRWLILLVVWLGSLTILIDDIANNDISFSKACFTFALIIAVGILPYSGWQIALIALAINVATMAVTLVTLELSVAGLVQDQIIGLILPGIPLLIVTLLYKTCHISGVFNLSDTSVKSVPNCIPTLPKPVLNPLYTKRP